MAHLRTFTKILESVMRAPCSVFRVPCFSRNTQHATRLLLTLLCLCAQPLLAADLPSGASEEGGRQWVPYDSPNEQQVKIELTFKDVKPLPNSNGKFLWKVAKIKQFAVTGGDPQMVAETPECVSDKLLDEISSDKSLQVHANRGAIFLTGVGFLFHQTNSSLVVSNQVHSVLQLRAPTNSVPAPPTDITSHRGEFQMKTETTGGLALYEGNVHVADPLMNLDCEWLKADLPKDEAGQTNRPSHIVARTNVVIDFNNANGDKIHALGQQAVYDNRITSQATNETLELTGNPRVNLTNGWMTADVFTVDRATGKLHGHSHYHFHYLPQNQATNSGDSQIAADDFEYDLNTRLAIFTGHVHATDPRLNLLCDHLTATLPKQEPGKSNTLDHIVAETNVTIDFVTGTNGETTHATGQKAVYDYKTAGGVTNQVLELTGNPSVEMTRGWMTADVIKLDRAQGLIWGTGSHHSVLKKSPGELAMMDTEIFSDNFEFSNTTGLAVYRGHVRAYDPQLNLTQAGLLTIQLAQGRHGQTNQIQKIVAETNVMIDFAAAQKAFERGDITNLTALATRLKATNDAVAQFVSAKLSPATKLLLANYTNGPSPQLQQALAEDLNQLTLSGPVYESNRFKNVYLSLDTSDLLKGNPMGLDLIQLNRLLLVDAFRGEIARGRTGEKTHATGQRAVYTNQGPDPSANALLELSGHPKLTNPSGWMEADNVIIYNRTTGVCQCLGHPQFHPNMTGFAGVGKKSGPAKKGTN